MSASLLTCAPPNGHQRFPSGSVLNNQNGLAPLVGRVIGSEAPPTDEEESGGHDEGERQPVDADRVGESPRGRNAK